MRTAALWFSARQLLWATLFVLATGVLLLVPLFIGPNRIPEPVTQAFRALHSSSSVVLVVGAIGHGIARTLRSPMSLRATTSGILASTVVGFAAVSGSMASYPDFWATTGAIERDTVENWASVFHFGYSAAMLVALVFWHIRPGTMTLLPSADRTTVALGALIIAGGIATFSTQIPVALTLVLVPFLTFWAWWTVVLPQLFWFTVLRRAPNKVQPHP